MSLFQAIATLTLTDQWQFTDVLVGSYFRVVHLSQPLNQDGLLQESSAAIAQADITGFIYTQDDFSHQTDPQSFILEKPEILEVRKLGFKLLPGQTPWDIRVEALDATLLAGGVGPQGIKGDTGDTGAMGPQGIKGDKGDTGDGEQAFDPTVADYFNLYATTATSRRKRAVNDFVETLKEQGIWDLLYTVWINSGDSEANIGKVLKGTNGTLNRALVATEQKTNGGVVSLTGLSIDFGAVVADTYEFSCGYGAVYSSNTNGNNGVLVGNLTVPSQGIYILSHSTLSYFPQASGIGNSSLERITEYECGGFFATKSSTAGWHSFRGGKLAGGLTIDGTLPEIASSKFNVFTWKDFISCAVYGQKLTSTQASKVSQLIDELARRF